MNSTMGKKCISRCCWQLMVLNTLALLVFPETFASSVLFGKTWLWLMATPVCILLVVHRHRFAAAWSTVLVHSPSRRRRQTGHVQARRKGFGRVGLRQNPVRAA